MWIGVGVLPLCVMLATSLSTTQNYTATLGSGRIWGLFRNSLLLATLSTAVAGTAGVTLGVILAKTNLALRNTLAAMFSLPLLFPPYILAVGWFEVLGRGGILAQCAGSAVVDTTARWLFGLPGVVLVLSTAFLPIVLLLTMSYVGGVNPNLEDAARLSSSRLAVLRRITVPLAAPGILLSLVLVFLLAIGEFGAPSFLRFDAFPVASFTQFTAFYNFGAATAAAMPLVLVVLLGLIVEQRVLHGKAFQFGWNVGSGGGPIPLGPARPLLSLVVIFTALAVVGVPLGALIWRGMNVTALREALDRAGNSAIRSVAYAAVSATVVSILGFFLAYLIHRRAIAGWRWVDAATLFLFTVPGTVIGLGLIGLWNHPSTNWIYATPAMLVGGYIAQYAALGTRAMVAAFAQTPVHLEEAAEIAGAAWFHRVRGILVPLLWPSILVGWAVSFLFCLRDVTLPLLLAPPGYDTLTARTMTLAANGSPELIAALCLLLIGLSMIPLGVCGAARRFWRAG